MALARIGDGAAEGREQEDGNLPGKTDQAEQAGRAGQPVHEP